MKSLNYKELEELEAKATKKLLTYIKNKVDIEKILEEIDFVYPYFQDESNRLAINLWLSIDYIPEEGKPFILSFLEEDTSLTTLERELLINKYNSYLSLFEIIDYDGEFIIVRDILQNEIKRLWEPNLPKVINEGELILARIGKLLEDFSFIGNMNYLPNSVKSMFMEQVMVDFNHIRRDLPLLTIRDYIKSFTLNLYRIYSDCIINAIENNEDITSFLYDELDEFEFYLQNKNHSSAINKHISNLIDFFEYYLVDEDMTLYDIDQLDFDFFFHQAIEDGFINSHDDLNSYISTFKKYLLFLNNMNPEYKESYSEILYVSKNRFSYMNKLKENMTPFKIDKNLSSILSLVLNDKANGLLTDYDKFLLYTVDQPLELTVSNRYIKRKHLLDLDNILNNNHIINKKHPNQEDFPLIHLFYYISIYLDLLVVNGNYLTLTKKGTNYLRLREEEKYTLFFQYIWDKDFVRDVLKDDNIPDLEVTKKNFSQLLFTYRENKFYEMSNIIPIFSSSPNFFYQYYKYFEYLGIIKCNLYPNYELMITSLGKTIFNYLNELENKKTSCGIINLKSFRESK